MALADRLTMGERVREAREERRFSQAEVARRAGLDGSYISKLERGKIDNPTRDSVGKIAGVLGMPFDAVWPGGDDSRFPTLEAFQEFAERLTELERMVRDGPERIFPRDARRYRFGGLAGAERSHGADLPHGEPDVDRFDLDVTGDCLEPYIRPGDVLVMSASKTPNIGDVVSVIVAGERLLKLVESRSSGALYLRSTSGELTLPDDTAVLEGVMVRRLRDAPLDRLDVGARADRRSTNAGSLKRLSAD